MKKIIILVGLFLSLASQAHAYSFELSTLMGTGNERMPFVREVVKDYLSFVPGNNEWDYTTGTIYFAWKNGIESVQAIQILDDRGGATARDLTRALDVSGTSSAIVLVPVGGGSFAQFCQQMANKPETAYIVLMGAVQASGGVVPEACLAKNILPVSGLNRSLDDLSPYEPFGPALRLAVPASNLSAPVDEGTNYSFANRAFGMAIAAGKMAQTLRRHPDLRGASLISKFLEEETDYLPALKEKVTGGRAIVRFQR